MATMFNYLAQKVIQYSLENIAFTPAATDYVSLDTTTSSAAAAGTQVTTTQLTGYAPQSIAASAVGWTYATNSVSNAAALTYTTNAATTGSFPVITGYYIGDGSGGAGNLYVYDNFGSTVTPATGNTVQFAIGGAVVTAS